MEAFSLVKFRSPVKIVDEMVDTNERDGDQEDASEDLDEMLSIMFPPRDFEQNAELWRLNVSSKKSDRYSYPSIHLQLII